MAVKWVWPGHTFLQRMIDLLTATGADVAHYPHHHIHLNREFRVDLAWWCLFLNSWNGVVLLGTTSRAQMRSSPWKLEAHGAVVPGR